MAPFQVTASTKYPVVVGGGTAAEQTAIFGNIAQVFGTTRGQQLESAFSQQNPLLVNVSYDQNPRAQVPGNNIWIDPTFHPVIQTTAGPIEASTVRIIGHEIGHAATGTHDDGPGNLNNVNQNENPIAIALGEPARIRY